MKHAIDPTVDCVFKALLGSKTNQHLLIHFLNAVLQSMQKERASTKREQEARQKEQETPRKLPQLKKRL